MARVCFVLVAGLDRALLTRTAKLPTLSSFSHQSTYQPAFPALTSTVQATLTTGTTADRHGIICNGLYTHGQPQLHQHLDLSNHAEARTNVSFWEQSNALLQVARFWHAPPAANLPKIKTAMLFWQNSMHGAADIVLTPRPVHTSDGKTLTACFSAPDDLYPTLTAQLGPFPLHNYWSPMAGLPSSQWIARAAQYVWQTHRPDLQLVYIPHLDFNLQRLGPKHPALVEDLLAVDALLAPLAAQIRADGATLLLAGDYGMSEVNMAIAPNLALRNAGLLSTRPDANGKLLIDYANSQAFVLADHQVAFLYCRPDILPAARAALAPLPGIADITTDLAAPPPHHLANPRAGAALLLARPSAFFIHDYWLSDAEKPSWQFTVDIHNKPGYDPRELFFDPVKKCIAQNANLIKGSHGLPLPPANHPVLLSDSPVPQALAAVDIASLLGTLCRGKTKAPGD